MIIAREKEDPSKVIPFEKDVEINNPNDEFKDVTVYIRYGQLKEIEEGKYQVNGLGTKITLKPKYYDEKIYSFDQNDTFID